MENFHLKRRAKGLHRYATCMMLSEYIYIYLDISGLGRFQERCGIRHSQEICKIFERHVHHRCRNLKFRKDVLPCRLERLRFTAFATFSSANCQAPSVQGILLRKDLVLGQRFISKCRRRVDVADFSHPLGRSL